MKEKLIELLKQCEKECDGKPCDECIYDAGLDCGNQHIADVLIANGVTIARAEDLKHTASLDYEAEYIRAMEEIAKAKCEISHLRDELRCKERSLMWHDGIKQTIEVIFGREFYNG
jgi:hypothetical protein